MTMSGDRTRAAVTTMLTRNKSLTEREVKAALTKTLGGRPINARVIRDVRRRLGIDRPRAVVWARQLLVKTPRLEAKRVIAEVRERFGVHFSPPDVTRLRPEAARQKRATKASPGVAPTKARGAANVVTITYHAKGDPNDVALFFRTLVE